MVKQKHSRLKDAQPEIHTVNDRNEEKIIRPEKTIILLGMNLEQNLSWNSHILTGECALLPVIRQQLGVLKYISGQVPNKSRILLANSLILSKITYGISIWGGTYETNLKKNASCTQSNCKIPSSPQKSLSLASKLCNSSVKRNRGISLHCSLNRRHRLSKIKHQARLNWLTHVIFTIG